MDARIVQLIILIIILGLLAVIGLVVIIIVLLLWRRRIGRRGRSDRLMVNNILFVLARWRPSTPMDYLLIVVVAVIIAVIDRLFGFRLFRRRGRYYDDDDNW